MAHAVNSVNRIDSEANRKKRQAVHDELENVLAEVTSPEYNGKLRVEFDVKSGTIILARTIREKTH